MEKLKRSVAVYKALIDTDASNDILDPFQKIVETAIYEDTKMSFTIDDITSHLESKWNISIPDMPMRTILGRIVNKTAITRAKGNKKKFYVAKRELLKETAINLNEHRMRIESDFDFLVNDFIEFTSKNSNVKIGIDDTAKVIESFVSEQATSFSLNRSKVSEKTNIYFASYFLEKCIKDTKLTDILKTITFGYILSESIFISSPNEKPKFSSMKIVFDTPILFKLLGISEIDEVQIYIDFVKLLQKSNAKICTFNHCVEEMERIIDGSYFWIENGMFDLSRASETSIFFVNNGYSLADIEVLRQMLRTYITEMNIEILTESYEENHYPFNQDENKIFDTILEVYKENNPSFKVDEKRYSMERDAKSISKTYILRMGNRPINLANCNAIFVTDNSSIVFASRKYNDLIYPAGGNLLATCIMDILLGTYLWLDNPMIIKELALKQLVSQAYSIMSPSTTLWNKFVGELTKCVESNRITPEVGYLLRTSSFVSRALVKTTMKDLSSVSYDTPLELFEKVKDLGKSEIKDEFIMREELIVEQSNVKIDTLMKNIVQKDFELQKKDVKLETIASKEIKRNKFLFHLFLLFISLLVYLFLYYIFMDFETGIFNKQGLIYFGVFSLFIFLFLKVNIKNHQDPYGSIYYQIMNKIENDITRKYQ